MKKAGIIAVIAIMCIASMMHMGLLTDKMERAVIMLLPAIELIFVGLARIHDIGSHETKSKVYKLLMVAVPIILFTAATLLCTGIINYTEADIICIVLLLPVMAFTFYDMITDLIALDKNRQKA